MDREVLEASEGRRDSKPVNGLDCLAPESIASDFIELFRAVPHADDTLHPATRAYRHPYADAVRRR